jgi:hypothetical protein
MSAARSEAAALCRFPSILAIDPSSAWFKVLLPVHPLKWHLSAMFDVDVKTLFGTPCPCAKGRDRPSSRRRSFGDFWAKCHR